MIKQNKETSILIVDDDRNSLNILFKSLEEKKFRILVAENGTNALRLAENLLPDLILLDVRLPDLDGFEVCRKLKAMQETKKIPVIFMTAATEKIDKLKGFRVGGVDYITKPFDCDELLIRVKTQLDIKRLNEELSRERNRFKRLVEATSEGVLIYNGKNILEANPAVETISGYSLAELTNRNIYDLFMPEFHDLIHEAIQKNEGYIFEVRGKKKDGKISVLKIQAKMIQYLEDDLKILLLHDISHERNLERKNRVLRLSLKNSGHFGDMVGISPVMEKIYEHIILAAASDETIVLSGETGTGKELAARMIFKLSLNYTRSFVTVNCASILDSLFESQFFGYSKGAFTGANYDMPGFFEQADKGTLFLDEIGELKPEMQAKLLRVLQNGEYLPVGSSVSRTAHVRIIAASNRNLREMVDNKTMRADFFHRLNVFNITLPPLRQRKKDIPLLARHFLSLKTKTGTAPPVLSEKIIKQLCSSEWPGNVRELFNVLRRYLVDGVMNPEDSRLLDTGNIPFLEEQLPLGKAVEAFEQYYINKILDTCKGKKKQAAEVLKVNRRTLYNKLKKKAVDDNHQLEGRNNNHV